MTPDRLNEIERDAASLVLGLDAFRAAGYRSDTLSEARRVVDGARELIIELRRVRAALEAAERDAPRVAPAPDPELVPTLRDALGEFPLPNFRERATTYQERARVWWQQHGFPAFMRAQKATGR